MQRIQFLLFGLACLLGLVLYAPLAWSLRTLYLDREVTIRVQEAIERTSEEQGWLISDMMLTEVTRDRITFLHRAHLRGEDPVHCYFMELDSLVLTPCDSL